MLKRIITSAVIGFFLIPALIFSDSIYFLILFTLFAVIGEFEMLRCLGLHKNIPISAVVYFLAAAGPVAARYVTHFYGSDKFYSIALPVLAVSALLIMTAFTFSKGKVTLEQACAAVAVCFYIAVSFTAVILLSDLPGTGKYTYLFVFFTAWSTDSFAYFTGMAFGKHKLIVEVSPKKTVEGAIGGIVACALAFIVFALIGAHFDPDIAPNYPILIIGAVFSSIIAQAGDLLMSAIKRSRNIKDFGKIFPGHGGVLDRFDSAIAVAISILFIEIWTDLL